METRIVLTVGAILLCGGCVGFIIARLSNPFQRGLGWLGCTFACGAAAAAMLALQEPPASDFAHALPQAFVLLAYVFLQVALLELMERKRRLPQLGLTLLALQAVADILLHRLGGFRQFNLVVMGVALTIQAMQSFLLLKRNARRGLLAPVGFIMALLVLFACFNVYRSVVVLVVGLPVDPFEPNPLEMMAATLFLAVGLGLGFGVFWMASVQLRQALENLANTDSLTGVANRRSFIGSCERELQRSARSGETFSLILIDLDHFKEINDRYGHSTGDAVLRSIADCLRLSLRNIDLLGRWGGEEFVALLPSADVPVALAVAELLRARVEALRVAIPHGSRADEEIGTTLSGGVTTCRAGQDTLDELLHYCDTALYQAKAQGRNQIVWGHS